MKTLTVKDSDFVRTSTMRTLKVLVIEDDDDDVFLLKKILKSNRYFYDVFVANSVKEASSLELETFDLILLDYQLGSSSGLEMIKTVRKLGLRTVIILITSHDDELLDDLAIEMGANDFLPKSELTATLLNRTIRHSFEREKKNRDLYKTQLEYRSLIEVSSTTLHNTSGIIKTLMSTLNTIEDVLATSKGRDLQKIINLIANDSGNFSKALETPKKSEKILDFMKALSLVLESERTQVLDEASLALRKTSAMRDIIEIQQLKSRDALFFESVSLSHVVQEALRFSDEIFNRNNITVSQQLKQDSTVRAPRILLIHAVYNLLKNAQEAMEHTEKKVLTIVIERKNAAHLYIHDTGHGISTKILKDMFTPGFTTKPNGTGLGLQFCRKTIEDLGGTLEIDTGVETGAGIIVILPIVKSEENTNLK